MAKVTGEALRRRYYQGQARVFTESFGNTQKAEPGKLLFSTNTKLIDIGGKWILGLELISDELGTFPRQGWIQFIFGDE